MSRLPLYICASRGVLTMSVGCRARVWPRESGGDSETKSHQNRATRHAMSGQLVQYCMALLHGAQAHGHAASVAVRAHLARTSTG